MMVFNPQALARALGGEARGNRVYAPGPGHSKHDRSLSVLIDPNAPEGFVVSSFAGDDWLLSKNHVRARIGLPGFNRICPGGDVTAAWDTAQPPLTRSSERIDAAARTKRAMTLWSEAVPPPGTLVTTYLAARGIKLLDHVVAADSLRFHSACPFGRERHPAMLAIMRDVLTNEPKAIHRTALKPDGSGKTAMPDGQSAKRMLGPAAGCAVKLIDDADVTIGLGIAEGIENALTAICAGWRPVWAAGCKGALAKFPVLSGIDALTVFSDPEPDGVNAARDCARRWQDARAEATVIIPPGGDWNDIGRTS